jgi:hypothetical protein
MANLQFFSLGNGGTPSTGYVPYTGATQNVDLGAFGLEGDFIQFSLTPTQGITEGGMQWNDAEGTLDLLMKGGNVTQQIGEETYYYVKNQSGSTISNGTLVRASGTNGASGHILVEPFLADGTYPSTYVIGIVTEDIANGEFGFVTAFGKVRGIQTNGANYGETWVDGQILYANSTISGGLTKTLPTSPNNKVEIAIVISASSSNGVLFVRPTFFPNLFQDEGTNISNPQANEFLAYDDAQEVWINRLIEVGDLPTNIPATNIADGSVSDTEFQYLNGVRSDIQPQIDSKISVSKSVLVGNFGASSVGAGATLYGGFVKATSLYSASQAFQARSVIPIVCVGKTYTVNQGAQPATGSCVHTIRIDGVDTAYTLTIVAGSATGVFQNTSSSINFNSGATIDVKIKNNASSSTGAIVAISMILEI